MSYYNKFNGRKPTPTKSSAGRHGKSNSPVNGSDEVVVIGVSSGGKNKDGNRCSTSKQLFSRTPGQGMTTGKRNGQRRLPSVVSHPSLNSARLIALATGGGFEYAKGVRSLPKVVKADDSKVGTTILFGTSGAKKPPVKGSTARKTMKGSKDDAERVITMMEWAEHQVELKLIDWRRVRAGEIRENKSMFADFHELLKKQSNIISDMSGDFDVCKRKVDEMYDIVKNRPARPMGTPVRLRMVNANCNAYKKDSGYYTHRNVPTGSTYADMYSYAHPTPADAIRHEESCEKENKKYNNVVTKFDGKNNSCNKPVSSTSRSVNQTGGSAFGETAARAPNTLGNMRNDYGNTNSRTNSKQSDTSYGNEGSGKYVLTRLPTVHESSDGKENIWNQPGDFRKWKNTEQTNSPKNNPYKKH